MAGEIQGQKGKNMTQRSEQLKDGVAHKMSRNALHITCESFEQPQANAVLSLLEKYHQNCASIFIDVQKIGKARAGVAASFKQSIHSSSITPQKIFFKGSCGFDLAVDGNRVLVRKPRPQDRNEKRGHVCLGNCKHCHCHHHD